jgi:hypothetical protein
MAIRDITQLVRWEEKKNYGALKPTFQRTENNVTQKYDTKHK